MLVAERHKKSTADEEHGESQSADAALRELTKAVTKLTSQAALGNGDVSKLVAKVSKMNDMLLQVKAEVSSVRVVQSRWCCSFDVRLKLERGRGSALG